MKRKISGANDRLVSPRSKHRFMSLEPEDVEMYEDEGAVPGDSPFSKFINKIKRAWINMKKKKIIVSVAEFESQKTMIVRQQELIRSMQHVTKEHAFKLDELNHRLQDMEKLAQDGGGFTLGSESRSPMAAQGALQDGEDNETDSEEAAEAKKMTDEEKQQAIETEMERLKEIEELEKEIAAEDAAAAASGEDDNKAAGG